jgi:hydrogenase nickel incorporation protein HypB
MNVINVPVVEEIMSANDQLANANRKILDAHGVFGLNIMSSPGSGKTSTIVSTQERLKDRLRLGMVDGDIATTIDADRAAEAGMQAVQINTGGTCHLDAVMLSGALDALKLNEIDLMIVENVGNLICPSNFKLGTHISVLIASVPEGDDKPYKYPTMYRGVDATIYPKSMLHSILRADKTAQIVLSSMIIDQNGQITRVEWLPPFTNINEPSGQHKL